jgi:hypothetical protein
MPVCQNGHDQPDFAKFCGTCGSPVNVAIVLDQDAADNQPTSSDMITPIDLDLMSDENDSTSTTEDNAEQDDTDSTENISPDDADIEDNDVDEDDSSTDSDDGQASDDDDSTDDSIDDDADTVVDLGGDADDSTSSPVLSTIFGTTVNASAMQLLHDWAEEIDELDDPYVKGLTNAVGRRDDLSVWASLDPLELLPVSKSKSWSRLGQISNVISAIRNILVFVPVLLTWLAISRAINAFGKFTKSYAEKNPGTSKNLSFIEFWQDPDGYLEGWWRQNSNGNTLLGEFWRIGDVAALDAYIILVIIVLTAISGAVTWLAENRESIALEKSDRKRVEVGLAIASSLHGKRQANPESISEALAEALNDLTQAARDVNETASRLEQASMGVESLTPRIEILNSHTEQLVSQTATSVSKAVSDLVASVQNLNSSVGGNVTTLFTEAANTLEEVSKQLARTSNSAEYGIKQLRDDLDAIHKQLQSLTKGGRP